MRRLRCGTGDRRCCCWRCWWPAGSWPRGCGWVEDYLLPAPSEVARALVEDRDVLLPDAWVTAQEVLLGFALALARRASALAVALHLSPLLRRALYPLVVASQAVPVS